MWEETRMEQNRLWTSTCLTLGHGRAVTLALLCKMVAQNTHIPGPRHPQPMEGDFLGINDGPITTRTQNAGPHPQGVDPSFRHPISWPKCLGRGLPAASPPFEPTPSSSLTSSNTDSSGPPSLESVTRPESRYEASPLSSNTE